MEAVHIEVRLDVEAAAEDTDYRIVMWREFWRVLNARNTIMAVCATREEAAAWIARQVV